MNTKFDIGQEVYFIDDVYCEPVIRKAPIKQIRIDDQGIRYIIDNYHAYYEEHIDTNTTKLVKKLIEREIQNHNIRIDDILKNLDCCADNNPTI